MSCTLFPLYLKNKKKLSTNKIGCLDNTDNYLKLTSSDLVYLSTSDNCFNK